MNNSDPALNTCLKLELERMYSNLSKVQDLCQRLEFMLKEIVTVMGSL